MPKDRGLAFAGISDIFRKVLQEWQDEVGEYCAGVWQDHLPESLLWTCSTNSHKGVSKGEKTPSHRIRPPMAPSWSWFSVNGHCRHLLSRQSEKYSEGLPFGLEYSRDLLPRETQQDTKNVPLKLRFSDYDLYGDGRTSYKFVQGALSISSDRITIATRTSASKAFALKERPGLEFSGGHTITLLADDAEDEDFVGELTCLDLVRGFHWAAVMIENEREDQPTSYRTMNYEDPKNEMLLYPGRDPAILESWYDFYTCYEHAIALALVAVPGKPETYRRIGLFHARGAACIEFSYKNGSNKNIASSEIPWASVFYRDWVNSWVSKDNITLI